jgi:hypothetical protein
MVGSLPSVSKLCAIGITPAVEMASCEGRKPRIPQYDAGTLTLPPVSVPMIENLLVQFIEDKPRSIKIVHERNSPKVKSTSFAPTATADPLEDPPGTRSGTQGFLGVP